MKFRNFLNYIGIKGVNKEGFEDWNFFKNDKTKSIKDKIKSTKKNIVIWGASEGGRRVLKFLQEHGIEPDYFVDIDKNKQGKTLDGIRIFSPSKVGTDDLVVIGSVFQDEIVHYLEKMNVEYIKNIFYILKIDSAIKFNFSILNNHFSILNNHLKELIEIFNLFSDKESRVVFSSYLKYILTTSPLYIRKAKYKQYFHPLVKPEKNDIIVDGGGFDGDTSCLFLKEEPNIKKIYSFEPDDKNFSKLVENCKDKKVVPIKMGLWSESDKRLSFNYGLNESCYVVEGGREKKISTISLDNFFKNKELPNLIKMDIEGSELEALKGAKEIIRSKKPKLQICLYHDPTHLFKIPLSLKSKRQDYKFFLGHHTGATTELILYAI